MTTRWMEAGSDETFAINDGENFNGWWPSLAYGGGSSITSSTDITLVGPRVIKALGTGSDAARLSSANLATTAGRLSFYFQTPALPGATYCFLYVNPGSAASFGLRLTSGGVLQLDDGAGRWAAGGQIGTDGATLSADTPYRICVAWDVTNTTTFEIAVFVNGTSCISASSGTLSAAFGTGGLVFGACAPAVAATTYFASIYLDDDSSLADTGDIRVTAKRPVANGASNAFDTQIGSGGSGYGAGRSPQVNERALSQSNGWQQAGDTQVAENYGIENAATGDIDLTGATIVARLAWVWAKAAASSGTPKIWDNGSEFGITLSAYAGLYMHITDSATYPSATAAVGMTSQGTADDTFLYECGMLIAYLPAAASAELTPSSVAEALTGRAAGRLLDYRVTPICP